MTNEFRTLNGRCDTLVPQGPGYENVPLANKVCAVVGAQPGESVVNGSLHLELAFGFKWSNNWMVRISPLYPICPYNLILVRQNFGIVVAFGVGFLIALLIFAQINTTTSTDTITTMYKRGSVVRPDSNSSQDEEAGSESAVTNEKKRVADEPSKEVQPIRMTDTFTWQGVQYSVPISGETDRTLLEDISGFVAPGKLTALMGESGAGKTTLLNVLAQRVYFGHASGEMLVNGQPLPPDFQSQTYGYLLNLALAYIAHSICLQRLLPANGYPRAHFDRSRSAFIFCQTPTASLRSTFREGSIVSIRFCHAYAFFCN